MQSLALRKGFARFHLFTLFHSVFELVQHSATGFNGRLCCRMVNLNVVQYIEFYPALNGIINFVLVYSDQSFCNSPIAISAGVDQTSLSQICHTNSRFCPKNLAKRGFFVLS